MLKIKFIILLVVTLFVVGLFQQRHSIACEVLDSTNFEQLDSNIFVSSSITNVSEALNSISEGKQRVNSVFGVMQSNPRIVLVGNESEANKLGANTTATTHMYSPLGTCIVLGPDGQNEDVSAHELTHAEVVHRVGRLNHLLKIPVWFNEGIALIVDYRGPFLVENIQLTIDEVNAVKELNMGYEFFGGKEPHKNYLASRLAVKNVKPELLYKKLERIRNGDSFENVFIKEN